MAAAQDTFRFFLCARCRRQVYVCSRCDRGQIYCSSECAEARRRESQRAAAKRYQGTSRGARNHALRQRRYRERIKKVTHQGSAAVRSEAKCAPVVEWIPFIDGLAHHDARKLQEISTLRCRFCGRIGSGMVRSHYLHSRGLSP